MRLVRPAVLAAVVLALGVTAGAARSSLIAPTGLHAFMLRGDEPLRTAFSRTPSFAWNPVPGAVHYEFELSLSTTFRDNSVVFADLNAPTPVEAPALTLPWITGNPHSLYARVRAVTPTGATPWSTAFGFDMVPPPPPTPLGSYPGVLRWTQVDGALAYQVWLLDARKIETVNTNVMDEREYYTFHHDLTWTGTVHWRVRAMRSDTFAQRINGIPAVQYGAWSPIYTSTNSPFAAGPIQLTGTVSDVFSDGTNTAPAQGLMPAFMWTGDQSLSGVPAELYRVYVFTDSQCLNRVFTSAVIGSQAYAPRPFGPLKLPATAKLLATARGSYLGDGTEPPNYTFDGEKITTKEADPPATPTTAAPGSPGNTSSGTTSPPSSSSSSPPSSSAGSTGPAPGTLSVTGNFGAPIDLWDVNWPGSGYYWTVVPVAAVPDPSDPTGSNLIYQDLELPQDACAAGRIMRFGKASLPSLTSSGDLFATGLSAAGRLTSAVHTTRFYGEPLVSWTTAPGADAYEVQWSKSRYPFTPEPYASGATGYMTTSTALVLPVGPGIWWYRVRGFDYSLPTGAQQMSWSDPARLVVAKPSFKIIGGRPSAKPAKPASSSRPTAPSTPAGGMRRATGDGFTLDLPATWTSIAAKDSLLTFFYKDPAGRANVNVLRASGRAGRSFAQWSADLVAQDKDVVHVTPSASVVTLPGGRAVRLDLTDKFRSTPIREIQYVVDAGPIAYIVTFAAPAASYASEAALFGRMIATFRRS